MADRGIEGVGGWLAFFLVTLGVFAPGSTIVITWMTLSAPELPAAYGAAWPMIQASEWALAGITALSAWFACWRMLTNRTWRSVQITIGTIWLICAINVVVEPLLVAMFAGIAIDRMIEVMIGPDLIRPFVYGVLWTSYLLKSERVSNTYRGAEQTDELGEVFE